MKINDKSMKIKENQYKINDNQGLPADWVSGAWEPSDGETIADEKLSTEEFLLNFAADDKKQSTNTRWKSMTNQGKSKKVNAKSMNIKDNQ